MTAAEPSSASTAAAPDLREVHARAALHFADLVAQVKPDQWQSPTPCHDWDVRALVDHVIRWNTLIPDFLEGRSVAEMDRPFERDVLGAEPAIQARQSAQAAIQAFAAPGAMDRTVRHMIGDIPAAQALFLRMADNSIHGWDLARAIGADTRIDDVELAILYAFATEHRAEVRASGAFGAAEVEVPETADTQTKVLGMLGRAA